MNDFLIANCVVNQAGNLAIFFLSSSKHQNKNHVLCLGSVALPSPRNVEFLEFQSYVPKQSLVFYCFVS